MRCATLALLGLALLAGSLDGQARAETVEVHYVTDSDRLNVASGGGALPAASRCLLRVESPHPAGKPDTARVTLAVEPKPTKVGWWARRFGKPTPKPAPLLVRVLDIPAGEVGSLLDTLEEERFFLRTKPLTTDAFVGVERKGQRFAKEFRSLPQLDALVMRTRAQGAGSPVESANQLATSTDPSSSDKNLSSGSPIEHTSRVGESHNVCRRLPRVTDRSVR